MQKTRIIIVGAGRLAQAIRASAQLAQNRDVSSWEDCDKRSLASSIVIHAGSGRELDEVIDFCANSKSPLIELATGTSTEHREFNFPTVICSNTALTLVKFLFMLSIGGTHFKDYKIAIEESHQATKESVPGTAVDIAHSLGLPVSEIVSCRDTSDQEQRLGIPAAFLAAHAFHRITIQDGDSSIVFETRVLGHQPYVDGVVAIVK
ncbi:MAG TPA: hypothetical protein VLC91_10170, partial [Spongiibacteraceae bacterium]|nr:hypothetical protein [Spongiibacteraceae bacterium]